MQVAFSATEGVWFLVGASPDLRAQIVTAAELTPFCEMSPIAGIFLPSAEVDAVMGLLHLREFQSFLTFATPAVQRILRNENCIFSVLDRASPPVRWRTLSSNRRTGCYVSDNPAGGAPFFYTAIPLARNFPDYANKDLRRECSSDDACVGFLLEQGNKKLFIAPTLSGENKDWPKLATSANVSILDGTFWSNEELLVTGRTDKTARAMGHLPLSGPDGLLAQYPKDAQGRKILIHINNTNPILDEDSDEHHAVLEAGFEIAYDGLTIEL